MQHQAPWVTSFLLIGEPGVSTILIQLVANKSGILVTITPLAMASLHALARWYERAVDPDDALLIDLKHLAANINRDGDAVRVLRGVWLREDADAADEHGRKLCICAIRTFMGSDSI